MRSMKTLQLMNIEGHYVFVEDRSGTPEGRKKQRKKRVAAPAIAVEAV
jgi:hypothetical protein